MILLPVITWKIYHETSNMNIIGWNLFKSSMVGNKLLSFLAKSSHVFSIPNWTGDVDGCINDDN